MNKKIKSALCHFAMLVISIFSFVCALKEECTIASIIFGVFSAYCLLGVLVMVIEYEKEVLEREDEEEDYRLYEDNEY